MRHQAKRQFRADESEVQRCANGKAAVEIFWKVMMVPAYALAMAMMMSFMVMMVVVVVVVVRFVLMPQCMAYGIGRMPAGFRQRFATMFFFVVMMVMMTMMMVAAACHARYAPLNPSFQTQV